MSMTQEIADRIVLLASRCAALVTEVKSSPAVYPTWASRVSLQIHVESITVNRRRYFR